MKIHDMADRRHGLEVGGAGNDGVVSPGARQKAGTSLRCGDPGAPTDSGSLPKALPPPRMRITGVLMMGAAFAAATNARSAATQTRIFLEDVRDVSLLTMMMISPSHDGDDDDDSE